MVGVCKRAFSCGVFDSDNVRTRVCASFACQWSSVCDTCWRPWIPRCRVCAFCSIQQRAYCLQRRPVEGTIDGCWRPRVKQLRRTCSLAEHSATVTCSEMSACFITNFYPTDRIWREGGREEQLPCRTRGATNAGHTLTGSIVPPWMHSTGRREAAPSHHPYHIFTYSPACIGDRSYLALDGTGDRGSIHEGGRFNLLDAGVINAN